MKNGALNDSYKDKEFVSTTEIAEYLQREVDFGELTKNRMWME